ncbi:MAG: cell envelope integrity protein TolA [Vulcanimicrobiota bacterium]
MSNSINYSTLALTSQAMAGDIGSGSRQGGNENGGGHDSGLNVTDSVEQGRADDIAVLMKEIKSLKKQVKELQAASVKEHAAKPEAEDANNKKSTFSSFTGFIGGKIVDMKKASEKREAEREAMLQKERADREAEKAAMLEKEKAKRDAAMEKEKEKALAVLKFKGEESVNEASEDLIMISESLRQGESLSEAVNSFLVAKRYHYDDRDSAIKTYKFVSTTIGEKDNRRSYTNKVLYDMRPDTFIDRCRDEDIPYDE